MLTNSSWSTSLSPSLSASCIISLSSCSFNFTPHSLDTCFRLFNDIFPVLSGNWKKYIKHKYIIIYVFLYKLWFIYKYMATMWIPDWIDIISLTWYSHHSLEDITKNECSKNWEMLKNWESRSGWLNLKLHFQE